LITDHIYTISDAVRDSRGGVISVAVYEPVSSYVLVAFELHVHPGNPHNETYLHALAGLDEWEPPRAIVRLSRPNGDKLHCGVKDIPYSDIGGRLSAGVADLY
jgi:hypothetical protein